MEDDPIYLGELPLDLLAHRDHSLSSSQNISSHMSLPWTIKESFMDYVRRDQEEHPYVVGLNSGIDAKLKECCEQRDCVSGELCDCVKDLVETKLLTSRLWL